MINGIANIPGIKEVRGGSTLLWQKQAAPVGYEPETTALQNAGITNTAELDAVDASIKYYKAQGVWANIGTFYPMLGIGAVHRGLNAKDANNYVLDFYGSWVFSSAGNKGNGANTYAASNFIPNANDSAGGESIAVLDNTAGAAMDVGQNSPVHYITSDLSNQHRFVVASYSGDQTLAITGGTRIGIYTGLLTGTNQKFFKDGTQLYDLVRNSILSSVPLNYGSYSTTSYFSPRMLGSFIQFNGVVDPAIIYEGQRILEEGLNRK